jgi:hypothetical protein
VQVVPLVLAGEPLATHGPRLSPVGAVPSPLMQPQVPVRLPATSAVSQKEYELAVLVAT